MKNVAVEQTPMRGADAESGDALYDEYVRGFDEVPVLRDAVALPPPRIPPPDFRNGERRDVRREARPDPYSARESKLAETEMLYAEYASPVAAGRKPKKKRKRKSKAKKRAPELRDPQRGAA